MRCFRSVPARKGRDEPEDTMTDSANTFRDCFPSLNSGGVYLDSAAKTLTCKSALESMDNYYSCFDVNIDRGIYRRSIDASIRVDEARSEVAAMIGVSPERLVFLPSTTWAINTVANGIPWRNGDRVVTTALEHHSNFLPWINLRRRGVEVDVIRPDSRGYIDPTEAAVVARNARLVAFTHASNAIGTLQDIGALTREARNAGALVVIDGAQGASHECTDIGEIDPDAYAFSGHKCFGPAGIGALYLSERMLAVLEPMVLGGGSAEDSSPGGYTLKNDPPWARFEPGTPNIPGMIGFGAAASFRQSLDWHELTEGTSLLLTCLLEGLNSIPSVKVYGPGEAAGKTPVVSFRVDGYTPHSIGSILCQNHGIMVRSGHHCAPTLWRDIYGRPEGAVRASLHAYNTKDDVKRLLLALECLGRGR